jgi:hypothetical protein
MLKTVTDKFEGSGRGLICLEEQHLSGKGESVPSLHCEMRTHTSRSRVQAGSVTD